MANIELIKVLRERTGAGMMDCKHALEECGNDVDKACDWLREKGIAKQAKKADKEEKRTSFSTIEYLKNELAKKQAEIDRLNSNDIPCYNIKGNVKKIENKEIEQEEPQEQLAKLNKISRLRRKYK